MRLFLHATGAILLSLLVAALWQWRWNHEMVRVYDLPPINFLVAFLVVFPLVSLAWWVQSSKGR